MGARARTRTPPDRPATRPTPRWVRAPAALGTALALGCTANGAGAQSGQSQGSGSDNAADDRVSSGPAGLGTGNDRLELTISGQIDRGVLVYDDGDDTGLIHVDNDNSSTRLRFVAESTDFEPLTLGAIVEVEFQSNPSNLVDQVDERGVGSDTFDERKFEVYVKSDTWGDLLMGQGATASDGTAEIDLSGTGLAGYSDVDDTGGGLRFRSAGALTETNVAGVYANLDGLGRDDRLRYDAPTFAGLAASVSFASDRARDVALRWERDRDDEPWQAAAALSWADLGDGDGDADGDFGAEDTSSRVALSGSVLLDAGWSLTLAGGRAEAPDRVPGFGYVKLGRRIDRFAFGQTRVSVDYHVSSEVVRADERAASVGVQLVQQIDRFGASLFAVLRAYDYAPAAGAFDGAPSADPDGEPDADRIDVAMIGLRVPF